jgi:hypothetical protein
MGESNWIIYTIGISRAFAACQKVDRETLDSMGFQEEYVLEVPKLPFVSFP